MNKTFKNEYILTKKLIKDYVYNILYKKMIIIGIILTILGLLLLKISDNFYMTLTLVLLIALTTILAPQLTIKQIEETSKKLNNGKQEKTIIKFLEKIIMDEGTAHLEFEYNQIKKIEQTKNFIALKISSASAILLLKKGFTNGNEKEFIEFINGKIGENL